MRNLGSQGINLVNATKVEYEKAMYIYLGNYLCLDLKEDFLHLFNFSQLKQVSFL